MKSKIMVSEFIFIFIDIIVLFIIQFSIYPKDVDIKDIASIVIDKSEGNAGYIAPDYHYEIDFDNNTVTEHIDNPTYDTTPTDSETTFTETDKKYFIRCANNYGFFNWKDSYKSSIYDMKGVDIHITFKNGMQKNINCYGKFPLRYEKMKKVFEKAFGYNIL